MQYKTNWEKNTNRYIVGNKKDYEDPDAYYVLCYPDFIWEHDPLRENRNDRLEIFKKYHQDLSEKN